MRPSLDIRALTTMRHINKWHEDFGDAVFWRKRHHPRDGG